MKKMNLNLNQIAKQLLQEGFHLMKQMQLHAGSKFKLALVPIQNSKNSNKLLLLIGLAFIGNTTVALAQMKVNSGSELFISNAESLYIGENLTNYGTITMGTGQLTLAGNLTDSGTIALSNATLGFSGSNAQSINLNGNQTVANVSVNKSANAISLDKGLLLVKQAATISSGTLTTNSKLTLKSDATATARIAASNGTISGIVNIEQFVPSGKRKYRHISHSFNSNQELTQLTNTIDITGNTDGITSNVAKTVGTGFTPTATNNPSAFWFNTSNADDNSVNGGWTAFTAADASGTNNTWSVGQGIRVLFRGAKGEGISSGNYTPSSVTIQMSGNVNQGNITTNLSSAGAGTGQGFNLIGNPYPSPVDISAVIYGSASQANINKTVYTRNPQTGAYVSQLLASGTPYVIPAYSAVFIKANSATSPSITFTEASKASTASTTTFKTQQYIQNGLQLFASAENQFIDNINLAFNDINLPAFEDASDAMKLNNDEFDFYSIANDGQKLATDFRPLDVNSNIPLGLRLAAGQKEITIEVAANTLLNNQEVYLFDNLNRISTLLNNGAIYTFTVDANNAATTGDNRLFIYFKNSATGLESNSFQQHLILFPNPAKNTLNIAAINPTVNTISYEIRNEIGQLVTAGNINDLTNASIDIQNLNPGFYFLHTTDQNKNLTSLKFIKE
jgi:hypothetical protein